MEDPRIRNVEKYSPIYKLGQFPKTFPVLLGKEIVYLLASRGNSARVEGPDWEEIFARIIGADWLPSNVGLDDVVFEQMAWGAKTVKNNKPSNAKKVRLISGRNSPVYSFGDSKVADIDPTILGEKILSIWNERVSAIRKKYKHLRTVVLIKSDNLLELAVFESETIMYQHNQYDWQWNSNNNIEGIEKSSGVHKFTWQPHGSQFTIIEDVPENRLALRIKKPPILDRELVLSSIEFDESWVQIL